MLSGLKVDESSDNPYSATQTGRSEDAPNPSAAVLNRFWSVFSIVCTLIGIVPIYGHFVHVGRDEQITVLVLMLAWAITCCNVVVCFFRGVLQTSSGKAAKWAFFTILLIGLAFVGYHGIRNAILELWA